MRASELEAVELVARHRLWIERHVSRITQRRALIAARPPLGRGREILVRGEPHRVVSIAAIDGRARTSVRPIDGRLLVVSALRDVRPLREQIERWLRSEARAAVEACVAARSAEMQLTSRLVTIRDQRTRWGSASRRGTLSFNWRLVMCPPQVLDYVVVHELAHLRVAGHSRAFWRIVDRHVADSRGARRWLREHHDQIRHALD